MNNSFVRNLLISTILWIVFVIIADNPLEKLLLISIFLALPFLLFLVPTIRRNGSDSRLHSFLMGYHPYVAFTIALSFVFPTGGIIAGVLSIPWAIYMIAIAVYGVRRLSERGWYVIEENAIDFGLIYGAIGGITLSIYSFGGSLLGFQDQMLLLTAAHFHFASIFSPVFMGFVGRKLSIDQKCDKLYSWTTKGMMISPLLVAIGIYTTHIVEFLSVIIYAGCLFVYSYFILLHISKIAHRLLIKWILQASAIIISLTIILSFVYSFSRLFGASWLSIEQMIWYHGGVNAIGFVLLGIIGWAYLKPMEDTELYGLPQTNINGKKVIGNDFLDQNQLADHQSQYAGLVDNLERFARNDFFPTEIHPKIRSFYENTILYDLAAQITWHRGFRLFAKVYKWCSSKIQQINLPNHDEVIQVHSNIIGVRNENQQNFNHLRAWVRTYKETNHTMFVAIYAEHHQENEHYLHITLPIPKSNLTGILRLEHGADLSLQITSLPRRGKKGDEGIYWMWKNFSFRLPLNEHFLIWVDEYGRLQATHRMWLFGLKMLSIEYEISGKER